MRESIRPIDIGLCLSGGGARAIAFHLGCMKALDEAGLLDRVTAISAVSGGSVLAALYCRRLESFGDVDRRATGTPLAG
jgi:NTE family protein